MLRLVLIVCVCALLGALAAPARAQTVDHPGVCAPHERAWSAVADGRDVAAMNRVFAATPAACPGLRRRISARIVAVQSRPAPARASSPSSRAAAPPRASEPLRPVNIPPEVRAALTPASYANLERHARRALAWFRPSRIQQVHYQETTVSLLDTFGAGFVDRNRSCELRFLPQNSTNVQIMETRFTHVHRTPFLMERTGQSRSTACHERDGDPGVVVVPASVWIGGLGAAVSATTSFGQDDFQFEADLDPSSSEVRTTRFEGRESSGSCRQASRFGPGQWQPEFPFNVYEMSCEHRTRARPGAPVLTTTATYIFVPELSAELSCGGRGRIQAELLVTNEETANVQVSREGDSIIRVRCSYESTAITMQGGTPTGSLTTKGEREDVITLQ